MKRDGKAGNANSVITRVRLGSPSQAHKKSPHRLSSSTKTGISHHRHQTLLWNAALVWAVFILISVQNATCIGGEPNESKHPRIGCEHQAIVPPPPSRTPRLAMPSPEEAPFAQESLELHPETYRSWQGDEYTMFAFEGRFVRILVPTVDFPLLGKARMNELVDRCDRLYSTMRDLLSWEPAGDGRLSIALAVDTCASGCGVVGGKGIEVEVDFQAYGAERIEGAYGAVWAILIHEMAHNFDPVSGPIFFTSDPAHAWTTFLSFYAMVTDGNGSTDHAPPYQRPLDLLDNVLEEIFTPYLRDESSTWENCILSGDCTFPSPQILPDAKQRGAQGALLLQYARTAGDAALRRTLRYLVSQVMASPEAWVKWPATQKADLLWEAMSVGAGESLGPIADLWKWHITPQMREALLAAYGDSGSLMQDVDRDGFSPAEGDCDDSNPEVRPRKPIELGDSLQACASFETSEILHLQEPDDFPGYETDPLEIDLPVQVEGANQFPGDIDRFSFTLKERRRVRFTLIPSDKWQGWCFFDHTREYGVWTTGGEIGTLTVELGPGPIGIRMAQNEGEEGGSYRLRIEIVPEKGEPLLIPAANNCTPFDGLTTLVETVDAADQEAEALLNSSLSVSLPSQIAGRLCPEDRTDWFYLVLNAPTLVRINLLSVDTFAGWVFLPSGELIYCPKGLSSGGLFHLPAGTNAFRITAQNSDGGMYRVVLQKEDSQFYQSPPLPIGTELGGWTLRTGKLSGIADENGAYAKFWVSGLGWVGDSPIRSGEALLQLQRLPLADPSALNYRFQLFSNSGNPIAPMTPGRAILPTRISELPVRIVPSGMVRSPQTGRHDASFRVERVANQDSFGRITVLLDGQIIGSYEQIPDAFTVSSLEAGAYAVRLASQSDAGGQSDERISRSYPFVVFESNELNSGFPGRTSSKPADLRDIRCIQSLKLRNIPSDRDLSHFESLREVSVQDGIGSDATSFLRMPRLRRINMPSLTPILIITQLPSKRLQVRGCSFGKAAVLQRSSDLLNWQDVPYTKNPVPDAILEVDVPSTVDPAFFRLATR